MSTPGGSLHSRATNRAVAAIIGAGPAGLTAAYELLDRTDIVPIVFEASDLVGGIARTVNYKGNRIDLGGHRFFSKSDRVLNWWLRWMPVQQSERVEITYHGESRRVHGLDTLADPETTDRVLLVRPRVSRIYFDGRFFDYPIRPTVNTVRRLGTMRAIRMAASYVRAWPIRARTPRNLEEFLVGRFGRELYRTFFKSYTEKVWGIPCSQISAAWGAQRIGGLSIATALRHFFRTIVAPGPKDISQRGTQRTLIDQFLYPKYGPGQMWEAVAEGVSKLGGSLLMRHPVTRIQVSGNRVTAVDAVDPGTGTTRTYPVDVVLSTMPVDELIQALDTPIPANVRQVAEGLLFRHFITIGLLLRGRMRVGRQPKAQEPVRDNWIYIHDPDVLVGRVQVFNNWSPYMVADPRTTWLGLEYFCSDGEELWTASDQAMVERGVSELHHIGLLDRHDVLDSTVLRMPKAYPAYSGTYNRFEEVRSFVERFENLYLLGRNGMHRYNNQDHSMLAAMTAVDNIAAGRRDKSNIWQVNTDQDYLETDSS